MKKASPELEAEARDFVRRSAEKLRLDPDKVWEDHHHKVLKKGLYWLLDQRKKEELLAADYLASRTPGRNSPRNFHWPWVETERAREPIYLSFADYLERTTYAKRMARCHVKSAEANRERLLSPRPKLRLVGADVWNLIEAALGRCTYCGSLAVETAPRQPNGGPAPWAHVGRRIGTLEHRRWRVFGGGNELTNLAWCCWWCNTWVGERRAGALDHGGFHPPPEDPVRINALIRERLRPRAAGPGDLHIKKKGYASKRQSGRGMAYMKERVSLSGILRGQGHETSCTVSAIKVILPNSGTTTYARYSVESTSEPLPEGLYELSVSGGLVHRRYQNGQWLAP